ncbi:hypothetical protein F4809DRAFT_632275 [Biscogniauxia mediterranea]|nr:hypothetical protein F4809DRAFT_632275 [Biscogniauxia mediterranea]
MEKLSDQIIYTGCWAVLFLYIAATLLVFVRRSCVSYAASFLFACALWIDLTLFNLWFLLPALYHHLHDVESWDVSSWCGLVRTVVDSNALGDVGLMMLGWFASSLSISNSLSMWENEGCENMHFAHNHGGLTGVVMRLAVRVRDYVGIEEEEGIDRLRIGDDGEPVSVPRRGSLLFAFPRFIHKYIPVPKRITSPVDGTDREDTMDEKMTIRCQEPDEMV